jgi:hypothetical protein
VSEPAQIKAKIMPPRPANGPAKPHAAVANKPLPKVNMSSALRREISAAAKIFAPFIAILLIVGYFHEFVLNAIKANVTINGLIISAATYGAILIAIRYSDARKDFAVIERFGREALTGIHMSALLEQDWLKHRYVRHYLGHIAKTGGTVASSIQQNAIENELRELSAEYEHKLELPQFLVGFMIAMGLLGTFIGLLETLTGISGMLDGFGAPGTNMDEQFMKLVVELRKPLAGMGIAFSASMFGLVTSLMLAIMMINLRRYISRVISCARNVMHDLIELRHIRNEGSGNAQLSPADLAAMQASKSKVPGVLEGDTPLQDLMYQAHDTSMALSNRIDNLVHKVDALMQNFELSIKSGQRLNDLLGFGPRMKETSEATLQELKGLATIQIEQQSLMRQFLESHTAGNRTMFGLIESQREVQLELTHSTKTVTEKLSKLEESTNGVGRHLWDIKESFSKVVSDLG